jgi:SAM-dependent methyltransferase
MRQVRVTKDTRPPRGGKTFSFDRAYYDRYYGNEKTRVAGQKDIDRLAAFVCAYLRQIELPVRRVLDAGCGLGFWGNAIRREFASASYEGVEVSEYLCRKLGWSQGSVVDYDTATPFDLVICQGVLQYLTHAKADRAITNLARLCRGALYLEALTREDWDQHCDQSRTDGDVYLRKGDWYRERLDEYFVNCGGGLFVRRTAPVVLYDLETLSP